ncbi:hypothetical protein Acr_26g0004560 [Actinidia rufa]|uniref:Uncharacterized protein n=1 Tax=Actinidia rufa TaxID=165716 RepID=A0A7J0H278_9ERIC|nr:hypothetical protein Acr_26g0004560 [Actinidia rufa]
MRRLKPAVSATLRISRLIHHLKLRLALRAAVSAINAPAHAISSRGLLIWDKISTDHGTHVAISDLVAHGLPKGYLSPNPLDRGKTSPWNFAKSSPLSSPEPPSECSSARQVPGYCLLLALGRGRILGISTRSLQNPIYTWKLSIARSSLPRHRQLWDALHMSIFPIKSPTSLEISP